MITRRYSNKSRGVTLLEVMLVTALILLGLVLGIAQYKKTVLQRNVAQIQNSVIALGNALQQYYNVNCYWFLTNPDDPGNAYTIYPISLNTNLDVIPASSSGTNPTLINYIPNAGLINNPYGTQSGPSAYTYQIDTRADFPALSISTQFAATKVSSSLLTTLQGLLKPTSVNIAQKTFTWNIVLNQPIKNQFNGLNPSLSYINAMAGQLWLDRAGRQYGMQYYSNGTQFTNVCAYWQVPKNRCIQTNNTARCDYTN